MSEIKIKSRISKHSKVWVFKPNLKINLQTLTLKTKKKLKKIKKVVFHKRFGFCVGLLLILLTIVAIINNGDAFLQGIRNILAGAGIYTEPIPSIEIESKNWKDNEPGAWHIDKSSKWVEANTAEINFEVNSIAVPNTKKKDVILVLDVSGSMKGDKINNLKNESISLVKTLLDDSDNRVSLVTFSNSSEVVADFTNDKSILLEKLNNLSVKGDTNYNDALLSVEEILSTYIFDSNREIITLFLTDGLPNIDNPRQIGTYEMLKARYPEMIINGVQYEMGREIIEQLEQITDNQFVADKSSLTSTLYKAVFMPETYETFMLEDYIDTDNFSIDIESGIEVSIGEAKFLEEEGVTKVIWNYGTDYAIGDTHNMTFRLKLKEEYHTKKGLYSTNTRTKVVTKRNGEEEQTVTSTKTPVLKNYYKLTYLVNTPSGCKIDDIPIQEHYVFENVMKNNDELVCDGYIFQGWEFVNNRIEEINDEIFVMPEENVTISAIWSKPLVSKSVDGTIHEKATLYKEIKKDAETNSTIAGVYNGNGADIFANDIYYYKSGTKSNVIFGQNKDGKDMCWQIVRTTETGGVKILYNGLASEDGSCNNTGSDSQAFSSSFNNSDSLAYVGYMYNKVYQQQRRFYSIYVALTSYSTLSIGMYYGDNYTLNPNTGLYTLTNPKVIDESTNYQDLVGKYTFFNKDKNASLNYIDYLIKVDDTTGHFLQINGGKNLEQTDVSIAFADSYIDNGDGTYTLDPATTKWIKKSEWHKHISEYNGKYTCAGNFTTCGDFVRYVHSVAENGFNIITSTDNFKYGNSVVYDKNTGKYTLSGTQRQFWEWTENYGNINDTHYTCFNDSGECDTVYYIFNTVLNAAYYIELKDGKIIQDALEEMLSADDVNKNDSIAKIALDQWYEENLIYYESDLEDTVFCNDRTIKNLGAWSPNGSMSSSLEFVSSTGSRQDLTCPNLNDRFSTTVDVGNGKLKHPIGLLSVGEANLMSGGYRNIGIPWRLMSPYSYTSQGAFGSGQWGGTGVPWIYFTATSCAFRPYVSLRPDIEYASGDGTVNNPYVIRN